MPQRRSDGDAGLTSWRAQPFGLRIRKGEFAGPVAEITIAGTLPEMFRALVPANDLAFERGIDVPTFRIDGMSVAGE